MNSMVKSSLAIAIVFTQFNGEPGMALISAFWGTWHIISGLLIALTFKRFIKHRHSSSTDDGKEISNIKVNS